MRKKLLRSRSGFEKPESREEAIMQNILGASNVLEPSESNIEEILKSILYNTPYTKEAEFEIEKILLAIKNNGTYDGKGESRDMKILIAILNDLDYTEEAESRIEELFIEWLHQRSSIKVLEGVPPLTFTSHGLPLINYLIEGNTVQSGTPTPDSPITPQGTGERAGNLFDKSKRTDNSRVVYTTGEIGSLSSVFVSDFIPIEPNTTYTLNIVSSISGKTGHLYALYDVNKNFVDTGAHQATPATVYTFTTPSDIAYIRFNGNMASVDEIMLNSGSIPLPYEPYGYKIPISSAGQITPVYPGEVQTTRKIKKLVLTGEEQFLPHPTLASWFQLLLSDIVIDNLELCTHYKPSPNNPAIIQNGEIIVQKQTGSGNGRIIIKDTAYTTVTDFKAYLAAQYAAGTPVTVWYVLATEKTAVVNEPLMKIGDYSDTLSMEQAGVEIPTVNGSNTLDVDTTLKPSNIYIEYK